MRRFTLPACFVALSAVVPLKAAPSPRPYTVEHYDVNIRADFAKQRLFGEATIRFHGQGDNAVSALEIDADRLQIIAVREGQSPQSFEQNRGSVFVVLTRPVHPDEQRTITVEYEAGAAAGLNFFPDQVVASNVSSWMPANDLPGERATLHLTLTGPLDMKAAASGRLTDTRTSEGQSVTEWQLDTPAEPARFGFALGTFSESVSEADNVKLRILGDGAKVADITTAAMRYLADRTGKRYPGESYTQVFTKNAAPASFAASLTLLPESYAQSLEKQPEDAGLLADQLAHQWFGSGITTRDWSDIWLSEGVCAFLADSFLGKQFGKDRYEREIQHARQMYDQLRLEGRDRPLSDSDRTTRSDAAGGIPEYKGAWFLYLLNQMVGDSAFWNGIRLYTSNQWGRAAGSEDFQSAFAAVNTISPNAGKKGASRSPANGAKNLADLFDMWVYGIASAAPKRSR
jgi:aminopeptidase N